MSNMNDKKNFLWNSIGTMLLSFNSLFLMIIVTRFNGTNIAGVFSFSFASACIINVIALYGGRTFQVSDNTRTEDSTYIYTRLYTSFFATLIAFAFVCFNQYDIGKSIVFLLLCIVKCLEALSDVYYGIIHKENKLYVVGKSLTYKSLLCLVVFFIFDFITRNIYVSCLSLVIIHILFLFFYDIKYAKSIKQINYNYHFKTIISLLKKTSYTFAFTFLIMLIVNIPRYCIDGFLGNNDQAIYGIISMPATFMMLFGQFILQPLLVRLSLFYKEANKKAFNKIIMMMSLAVIGILVIILPVAYFLGIPVLELIYNVPLNGYTNLLLIVLAGSAFYAVSNIFLNALVTLRCTKEQLILQIVTLIISIVISVYLTKSYGIQGSILSYALVLFIQFVSYFMLYKYILNKKFKRLIEGCEV